MKSVAPNFFAHDSLPGLVSMAIIRLAPTRADVLITPRPIAPHPKTATEDPSDRISSQSWFLKERW